MKTITVNVREFIDAEMISTREAASILNSYIEKNTHGDIDPSRVNIDFKGVSFVSRSFADEISRVKENLERSNKKVDFINVTVSVQKMIDLVRKKKSGSLNVTHPGKYEVIPLRCVSI